jgi:cutinase
VSPLASVAATLACGALLLPPAVSHADQPSITAEPACPDVEVVFARGTAEPPGAAQMKAAS